MTAGTRRPTNDLADDEDRRVVLLCNALRQARQGKPNDVWEWAAASQDDVDAARQLVAALDAQAAYR